MPRPRRTNLSRQSRNATKIRSIANEWTEKEQEIAKRVSMARLHASQSQEQIVRSTDSVGQMCTSKE